MRTSNSIRSRSRRCVGADHPPARRRSCSDRGSCDGQSARAVLITIAANRVLTGVTNVLFGSSLTDMETCYKIMRTDVARSLNLHANRFDIEPEITARLLRAGHRIHELPVQLRPALARAGQEDRLARRRPRDAGAGGGAVQEIVNVSLILNRLI